MACVTHIHREYFSVFFAIGLLAGYLLTRSLYFPAHYAGAGSACAVVTQDTAPLRVWPVNTSFHYSAIAAMQPQRNKSCEI